MRTLTVLTLMALSGCTQMQPEWMNAPAEYQCSAQQLQMAVAETKVCDATDAWVNGYCYATSLMKHCTKRTPPPEAGAEG